MNYAGLLVLGLTLAGCSEPEPSLEMATQTSVANAMCQPMMPIIGSQPWDDHGYLGLLAQQLLENDHSNWKLHMLQAGSGREMAVQVAQDDDGIYRVISRRMTEPVFATAEDYREVEASAETWEVPIEAELFQQLDELWRSFIFGIRVPTFLNSFDRPHYYFSGIAGPMAMTGYADGPKAGTCLGELRDIGDLLFALPTLSEPQRAPQLERIKTQIAALRERLEGEAGR